MKTKRIIFMGLLIACSFIGANLKIFSTIAFDSMPGFLGALMLGPINGGIIAAIGYLLTEATSGFPKGLPTDIIIMICMFMSAYAFAKVQSFLSKKYNNSAGIIVGVILAVLINGPIALLAVSPIIGIGIFAVAPVLSLAAAANVILAQTVYLAIPMVIKDKYKEFSK
jgi:hypothetical protein